MGISSMKTRIIGAAAAVGVTLGTAVAWAGGHKTIVETAIEAGNFETLVTAVKAADLVETLSGEGPYTVFAPNDAAFAKLPEGTVEKLLENPAKLQSILMYHVVPGKVMAEDVLGMSSAKTWLGQSAPIHLNEGVEIADAKVIATDIECSNGVIHVIDSVMMPKDIVELAIAADQFSTLVAALKAAGLVDALKGDGPFTVFAPTNAAFAKLPEGTVSNLLKPDNVEQLRTILKYHVVPARVLARDVVNVDSAESLQGSSIDVDVRGDAVYVDDAKVVATDVLGLNGVIHVIDTVIMP